MPYPLSAARGHTNGSGAPLYPTLLGTRVKLWVKGNSITGVSDGGALSSFTDLAGLTISQATSSRQPHWRANVLNGKGALRFDGFADMLSATLGASITAPFTYVVLARVSQNHNYSQMLGDRAANNFGLYGYGGASQIRLYNGVELNVVTTNYGEYRLFVIKWNGASTSVKVNGGSAITGNAGTGATTLQNIGIGGWATDNTLSFGGDICEMLIVDPELDASETALMESYLASEWAYTTPRDGGTARYYMLAWKLNDQHNLNLWQSENGEIWKEADGVTNPVYADAVEILRDPWIYDDGTYYWCVYGHATGSNIVANAGLAKSTDAINWTKVTNIDCSAAGALCYAGKWFVDPADSSVHVIIPVLAVDNTSPAVLYEIHPTNAAMTTWSTPVQITGVGFPSSIIDPFMVYKSGTYYLWYKDERAGTYGQILISSSSSPFSGYTTYKTGDWAGWATGGAMEAITVEQINANVWRVYADNLGGNGAYGLSFSESYDDWATWTRFQALVTPYDNTGISTAPRSAMPFRVRGRV